MRGIELLHPKTREKAEKLVALAAAKGYKVKITDTLRTKAEQDALYAQGRTAPGNIVTSLMYPRSIHSWYHAFDICQNIAGKEYDESTDFWLRVGEIGESLGLEWGGRWTSPVDKPHFQDKEFLFGYTSADGLIKKYGTPEKYKSIWEGDEEMTQDQFNAMLETYFAEIEKKETSEWSGKEGYWKKAVDMKVFDGTKPQSPLTREQAAAMLGRLGLI